MPARSERSQLSHASAVFPWLSDDGHPLHAFLIIKANALLLNSVITECGLLFLLEVTGF